MSACVLLLSLRHVCCHCADLPAPFPYPRVMGVQSCFADLDDSNLLMVSCSFDTSVIMGYLAIVQFSGSYEVRTKASRDISTPVEFEGLDDGSYSVTVFPLTESGILGTYVVHSELITVTSPTTEQTTISSGEWPCSKSLVIQARTRGFYKNPFCEFIPN